MLDQFLVSVADDLEYKDWAWSTKEAQDDGGRRLGGRTGQPGGSGGDARVMAETPWRRCHSRRPEKSPALLHAAGCLGHHPVPPPKDHHLFPVEGVLLHSQRDHADAVHSGEHDLLPPRRLPLEDLVSRRPTEAGEKGKGEDQNGKDKPSRHRGLLIPPPPPLTLRAGRQPARAAESSVPVGPGSGRR